jgi:anti-anti-sigma regulatory factor
VDRQENAPCAIRTEPGTIFLEGKVSSAAWPDLMKSYVRSVGQGPVTLDFSGMESLEVPGLNALVRLAAAVKGQGGNLAARGLSPEFREVFASSRIDEAIPVGESSSGREGREIPAGWPWARPTMGLRVSSVPEGAFNLNIDGRRPAGPIQGFGRLWDKTYRVALPGIGRSPAEVVRDVKEHFPGFQPEKNRFYPSPAGIAPGEVVIINANTPGGLLCTGVWVLHADDLSFTLMAPEGHPEAGWVSFTAFEEQGVVTAQIQGFARASDPLYEMAFVLMGSKEQEGIWMHVLGSLARHYGVASPPVMEKTCVGCDYQWDHAGNILYNAQIMTMMHTFRKIVGL